MSFFKRITTTFSGAQKPGKAKPAHRGPKQPKHHKPKPPKVSQKQVQAILFEAQSKGREIILEAKDEALKLREQTNQRISALRQQQETKQRQLVQAEAVLKQKQTLTSERLKEAEKRAQKTKLELEEIEKLKAKHLQKLEKIASLSRDEAKKLLLDELDGELAEEQARRIKDSENEAQEKSTENARDILIDAMKHGATDYVAEYTVSAVKIPGEDIKGRIIGKEGRNIRAFERATGVDLDLDESPNEVRLSCFDPVRREIARSALTKLIADGRIQPSRIDEYVQKATQEIARVTFEEGKKLAHAVGVYNLPKEILETLGKFKFRFSYGQNMIAHTLEETKIGIALARETKANVDTVRLGCLLHDIGKVINDEEGSHVDLGVKFLKKMRIPQVVVDCVAQHHEDIPFTSNESMLVYISDAISGARPGARYEDYDEYVKRLTDLEDLAKKFSGIKEAYAIQAGREVRVIVNPDEISDVQTKKLAHKLKTKIQKELTYPGTVKVNVIREVKVTEVAT